jgi:hypothetical protein
MTSVRQSLNVAAGAPASIKHIAHQRNKSFPLSVRQLVGAPPTNTFLKNQVEILPNYVHAEPGETQSARITAMINALEAARTGSVQTHHPMTGDEINQGILEREEPLVRLKFFLEHLRPTVEALELCFIQISQLEFGLAEGVQIPPANPSLTITLDQIEAAFTTEEVTFDEIVMMTPTEPEIHTHTAGAYQGPILNLDERVAVLELVRGGRQREFQLSLLDAEIALGKREYQAAIGAYDKTLNTTPLYSASRKFVSTRCASAHAARGDALFRKFRNPDEAERKQSREAYEASIRVLQSSGMLPDNPSRQQIEQYATIQIGKLDAKLNFIGYRDSYVPILKPAFLQDLAEQRVLRAKEAITKFELFKSKADQIQDQLADLDFDEDIKTIHNQIAAEDVANKNAQKTIAIKRVEQLQNQIDALDTALAVDLGSSLLQGVAAGFLAGQRQGEIGPRPGTNLVGVAGSAGGIASAITTYRARKSDLKAQKRIAKIESEMAARDVEIAKLEQRIVGNTLEFLGHKISRIKNRELNPNLYYAAAEDFRVLAQRHLNRGIELAYLFERAVAFLRLEPELPQVQFDYEDGNMLSRADTLEAKIAEIALKNVPLTKYQALTESYSLRAFYPIEFGHFLQTGEMDFTMSLYEMNKRRPGVWRQRIRHVDVRVTGLIPNTGYTGRITHRGSFLLRDNDTTPEPGAGSLLPSDERLSQIFEELRNGAAQGVSIDGVMPFLLDKDTIEISPDRPPPDLENPAPEALGLIEGYGPAGDWRLEIENIDLRLIADVSLVVTYAIPESDDDLSRRVKGLVATYEQEHSPEGLLDLITPFSLRTEFGDVFDQLSAGQASLILKRQNFPSGIANLRLKTVVVQALDNDKNAVEGVTLEIARPGTTLALVRTTRADGFTEDVTLPIPNQFSRLGDLLVFFIYEFQEI